MAEEQEINILKHVLVPKHEILGEEEVKKLLAKYDIVPQQLPKVLSNDAAIKAIGAKAGDIVRVTRKSPTAGSIEYYRLVIKR